MENNNEVKTVSVDSFKKFTKFMNELIVNKVIKINFNPDGIDEVVEDEFSHLSLLKRKLDIDLSEIDQCRGEFYTLLFLVLKLPKDYLKLLPKEEETKFKEKTKFLEDTIINDKIVNLYNFHIKSKSDLFEHLGCELIQHRGKGEQRSIPSARILIKIRNPSIIGEAVGSSQEYFTFDCTKDDINEMIKELREIERLL